MAGMTAAAIAAVAGARAVAVDFNLTGTFLCG
jgi:hypothetical protein